MRRKSYSVKKVKFINDSGWCTTFCPLKAGGGETKVSSIACAECKNNAGIYIASGFVFCRNDKDLVYQHADYI